MDTSTTTLPGFMLEIISRVTSCGARAPWISTPPMTTSATLTLSAMLRGLEARVVRLPCSTWLRKRNRSRSLSMMTTWAPMPRAIWAELMPTTPPPSTTTSDGRTPGTPPSSLPRPPSIFSRRWAAFCTAMRPATSHGGQQRKGAVLQLHGLVGHARHLALHQFLGEGLFRGQVQVGEEQQVLAQEFQFGRLRLLDLHDHLGAQVLGSAAEVWNGAEMIM